MEEKSKEVRKTMRDSVEKHSLITRINRIAGQMNGIRRMVEEDRYCDDILIQLSAIDMSIKSLANLILDSHLHNCLPERLSSGDTAVLDEVVELFKRFQ